MRRVSFPKTYHQNLGREFDGHCLAFLHLGYSEVKDRVLAGGTDEEILEWCFANGRRPHEGEIEIFNGFMQKAGWRDPSSTRLAKLLQESNLATASLSALRDSILSNWTRAGPRLTFAAANQWPK
jgi:gluconokinase